MINKIIDWLKAHGEPYNDSLAFEFTTTDEPWMAFSAEWQDWSHDEPGRSVLYLSYDFEENGDLCFDPQLTFHLRDSEITRISYSNWMGSRIDATDDPFALDFAKLVWERHLEPRSEGAVVG